MISHDINPFWRPTHIHQEHLDTWQLPTGRRGRKGVGALGVGADVKLQGRCLGKWLVARPTAFAAVKLYPTSLRQGGTVGHATLDTLPLGKKHCVLGVVRQPAPARLDAVVKDGLADEPRDRPAGGQQGQVVRRGTALLAGDGWCVVPRHSSNVNEIGSQLVFPCGRHWQPTA